jgi:hypothetical protein
VSGIAEGRNEQGAEEAAAAGEDDFFGVHHRFSFTSFISVITEITDDRQVNGDGIHIVTPM